MGEKKLTLECRRIQVSLSLPFLPWSSFYPSILPTILVSNPWRHEETRKRSKWVSPRIRQYGKGINTTTNNLFSNHQVRRKEEKWSHHKLVPGRKNNVCTLLPFFHLLVHHHRIVNREWYVSEWCASEWYVSEWCASEWCVYFEDKNTVTSEWYK